MLTSENHHLIPEVVDVPSLPNIKYKNIEKKKKIGAGDQSDVYLAEHEHHGETFQLALKEPRLDGTVQAEVLNRFNKAVETWSNLDDHENIVSIHGHGSRSVPWIAMEYMDAGTITENFEELELEEALWMAGRIAEGIRHGHRHGVTHLDINPSNILLQETPEKKWNYPKVTDWGLTDVLLDDSESVGAYSPMYAAPEQLSTEDYGQPDDMTDIYQFGVVVFELLTGQPPFTGSIPDLMQSALQEKPPIPSDINPELPSEVDELLVKALSKEKSDRHESILIFRRKLDELFYQYADGADPDPDVEKTRTAAPVNQSDSTEGNSTDAAHEAPTNKSGSSSTISRRTALASLGVIGIGGVGVYFFSNSSPSNPTTPENISFDDLTEAWTPSDAQQTWGAYTHGDAFFTSGWAGLIGRRYDNGEIIFRSPDLQDEYSNYLTDAAISSDGVFIGTRSNTDEGANNAILYGFDRSDETIRFGFETPSDGNHNEIEQVTKINNGPVLFGTNTGGMAENQEPLLYAVDPQDGTERWRAAPEPRQGFVTGLLALDETVYAMINGLKEYDATTGDLLNELDIQGSHGISYADNKIITSGKPMKAYHTSQKEVVWETESPGGFVRTPLTPADSKLFGATSAGIVFALDAASGDILWRSRIRGGATKVSPTVLGPTVWISANNGEVYVLEKETGKEAFTIAPPPENDDDFRPTASINDVMYLGGNTSLAYRFDFN